MTRLVLPFLLVLLGGCAQLLGATPGGATPPTVRVAELRVVEVPTARGLAAFACERAFSPLVCRLFAGGETRFAFVFDLDLAITNPSPLPMPLVQALVAFQAYPEAADPAALGVACVDLCAEPGACAGAACVSNEPLIRDRQDFANAAAGFLVGVATGVVDPRRVAVSTIPPGETVHATVRLTLDPAQMVDLVLRFGRDVQGELRAGRVPDLSIPYAVEGAVWVEVSGFGRIGANFGPLAGEVPIPGVARR